MSPEKKIMLNGITQNQNGKYCVTIPVNHVVAHSRAISETRKIEELLPSGYRISVWSD